MGWHLMTPEEAEQIRKKRWNERKQRLAASPMRQARGLLREVYQRQKAARKAAHEAKKQGGEAQAPWAGEEETVMQREPFPYPAAGVSPGMPQAPPVGPVDASVPDWGGESYDNRSAGMTAQAAPSQPFEPEIAPSPQESTDLGLPTADTGVQMAPGLANPPVATMDMPAPLATPAPTIPGDATAPEPSELPEPTIQGQAVHEELKPFITGDFAPFAEQSSEAPSSAEPAPAASELAPPEIASAAPASEATASTMDVPAAPLLPEPPQQPASTRTIRGTTPLTITRESSPATSEQPTIRGQHADPFVAAAFSDSMDETPSEPSEGPTIRGQRAAPMVAETFSDFMDRPKETPFASPMIRGNPANEEVAAAFPDFMDKPEQPENILDLPEGMQQDLESTFSEPAAQPAARDSPQSPFGGAFESGREIVQSPGGVRFQDYGPGAPSGNAPPSIEPGGAAAPSSEPGMAGFGGMEEGGGGMGVGGGTEQLSSILRFCEENRDTLTRLESAVDALPELIEKSGGMGP